MFAFSQIVASGGNPMEVAAQIEKEAAAKKQEEKKIAGLSEDQAMAAFAEFVGGDGTDPAAIDPAKIKAEKEAAAKSAKAKAELAELSTNEATSAFACLVDSQVIQEKANTYEGSGNEAELEAAIAKGQVTNAPPQSGDALQVVQQKSEAELNEANKAVENTDTAQEAAARLGTDGNVQTGEETAAQPAPESPSNQAAKPPAPKKPTEVKKKAPAAKPKAPAAKKQAAAPKQKPAPKAPEPVAEAPKAVEPEHPQVDLAVSLAASESNDNSQVDQQADEILQQIRSAAVGIKGLGAGADGVDESALQAAVQGMNLLQLDADLRDHDLPDENAQMAMEYLAQQFPEEYPRDIVKPAPPKGPSQEEKEASEKKALLAYAQQVTEEATASRDKIVNEIADKEERKKLARMGMEDEPVTLQLSADNLIQLDSNLHFDADALEAQSYLESQFPDEFPQDPVPAKKEAAPSPQEVEKQKQREFLKYAEQVTEAATESRDQVVQQINDKKEREELSKMGREPDRSQPEDWKQTEAKRALKDARLIQVSQKIVLDGEEAEGESERQNRGKQVTLAQVNQMSEENMASETQATEGLSVDEQIEESAEQETVALPVQTAAQQSDLSGMSADDMRSYSESVAQAADVVNSESEMDKQVTESKGKAQLTQSKVANQKVQAKQGASLSSKDESLPFDQEAKVQDQKNADLEAKAALVAQAEAANQAAIDDPNQQVALSKQGSTQKNGGDASLEELDADQLKEQQKQIDAAKYLQDKKTALDQGYTEEQAELFAKQEAFASKGASSAAQAPAQPPADQSAQSPATMPDTQSEAPTSQPNILTSKVPKENVKNNGKSKSNQANEAQALVDSGSDSQAAVAVMQQSVQAAEESSIEQQIKQAQEQQAMIKAQLEKRKQEKESLLAMNQATGNDQLSKTQQQLSQATPSSTVNQQKQTSEIQPEFSQPVQSLDQLDASKLEATVPQSSEQLQASLAVEAAAQESQQTPQQVVSFPQPEVTTQSVATVTGSDHSQSTVTGQMTESKQKTSEEKSVSKNESELRKKKDEHKTHKIEKSTLQESEDIHRHVPKEVKKQLKSLNKGKSRAQQYEEDLNKARDEIQKAQIEMKNIDGEVADFHQKMAKSMHSLLKAFTEGFEAMDKAKSDELDQEIEERAVEKKRANKFDKLNLGISNLQALTSKLKLSFGDESKEQAPGSTEAIQATADIHQAAVTSQPDVNKGQKAIAPTTITPPTKPQPMAKVSKPAAQPAQQIRTVPASPKSVPLATQKKQAAPASAKTIQQPKPQATSTQNKGKPQQPKKPQAVKSALTQVQSKQAVKHQAQPKAANKVPQPAKVTAAQAKTVKIQKNVTPLQAPSASKAQQSQSLASTTQKQKLVASKSLPVKKSATPIQKLQPKTATKLQVTKPVKIRAISTGKLVQKSALPLSKTKVKPVSQMKTPPVKTGVKMIQLKKKPTVKPTKMVAKTLKPLMSKKAVGLAQVSDIDIDKENLVQTSQEVVALSRSDSQSTVGLSADVTSETDSDQLMAHSIADRILAQLDQGKSQEQIVADLAKTKEALQLAKKAYYGKDPEAIELLQLSDSSDFSTVSESV